MPLITISYCAFPHCDLKMPMKDTYFPPSSPVPPVHTHDFPLLTYLLLPNSASPGSRRVRKVDKDIIGMYIKVKCK